MTLTVTSTALASLRNTDWRMVRYTYDGVTASPSSDMGTTLTFDADGGFRVASGPLSGSGAATLVGDRIDFGSPLISGGDATGPGSLEDRIVRACQGPFHVTREATALRLQRDGTVLTFHAIRR